MRFTVVLLMLLSSLALAAPKQVNMPVGHSTTLALPAAVSSVTVANPSLVDVAQSGRRVVLTGRSSGTTEVVVKTSEGELHLKVYVAADKYGMPH